ncbi:PilZ domain-containing protein [Thalassotalea sp. ND16A]|uniref:PilZ domain-containing protein n=1 Tax=Thalassotalea sp. ND16A TaxID=1535422 RepID=UPI00051A2561|nr:PilZ domain-containing protein [Thalassotalea sp. ND16A]KGJ87840.1 hypothetical protein ND16A_2754 [Thalassotalea sp. ND16A]
MLNERRYHLRLDVDFNVSIILSEANATLEAKAVNLSLSGIQLNVDKQCIDNILAHCSHPPQFQIKFIDQPLLEPAVVRLIVNRRVSQNRYLLGMKFIAMTNCQQSALKAIYHLPN